MAEKEMAIDQSKLLEIARDFAKADIVEGGYYFFDKDVNDVAATPLSVNRCIKVSIKYSDRYSDQPLDEMLSTVTDENRPELVDFGKPVGKEVI